MARTRRLRRPAQFAQVDPGRLGAHRASQPGAEPDRHRAAVPDIALRGWPGQRRPQLSQPGRLTEQRRTMGAGAVPLIAERVGASSVVAMGKLANPIGAVAGHLSYLTRWMTLSQ